MTNCTKEPENDVVKTHNDAIDLIKRQDAIDALRTCYDTEAITYTNGNEYIDYDQALDLINALPSAQLKTEGMKMIIFFKNGFQLVVTCTEFRLDKDIFGNVTGYEIKGISDNKLSYIDWSEVVCVYRDLRGESDE